MDGVIGSSGKQSDPFPMLRSVTGGELVLTTINALPEYFEPPDQLTSKKRLHTETSRSFSCGNRS